MIQPVLKYEENAAAKIWKEKAVSAQTAQTVKQSLLSVIENPSGTGASAKIDGVTMLGKTGTAEIKESQDDTTGVERGWFICETTEDMSNQIAVVGMVEDVKTKGGLSLIHIWMYIFWQIIQKSEKTAALQVRRSRESSI